ncbi:hypothetical protein [Pseudoclavibacter helvolus]|uniref:hypothetical protein n=1 Tax=Pseudoclavibacter helvolus TaxID=255205 RepID=UPI0008396BD8|nr:hypothetical protein [Pseudoclavibacter helvolus]
MNPRRKPIPVVRPVRIARTRDTRLVYVVCPYCGKKHQHGWGYDIPRVGHRIPHCEPGQNTVGYIVQTPDEGGEQT